MSNAVVVLAALKISVLLPVSKYIDKSDFNYQGLLTRWALGAENYIYLFYYYRFSQCLFGIIKPSLLMTVLYYSFKRLLFSTW